MSVFINIVTKFAKGLLVLLCKSSNSQSKTFKNGKSGEVVGQFIVPFCWCNSAATTLLLSLFRLRKHFEQFWKYSRKMIFSPFHHSVVWKQSVCRLCLSDISYLKLIKDYALKFFNVVRKHPVYTCNF